MSVSVSVCRVVLGMHCTLDMNYTSKNIIAVDVSDVWCYIHCVSLSSKSKATTTTTTDRSDTVGRSAAHISSPPPDRSIVVVTPTNLTNQPLYLSLAPTHTHTQPTQSITSNHRNPIEPIDQQHTHTHTHNAWQRNVSPPD